MAVKIRLARHGKKKHPFYRIIAADSQAKRDGRFIEMLGTYDPNLDPAAVTLVDERIQYWIGKGAIPTDTVRSLLRKHMKAE
ncbi:MAG: 30S ribosomal protein S16 [Pseudomonadota bacterium]